jgi:hypothetical protein
MGKFSFKNLILKDDGTAPAPEAPKANQPATPVGNVYVPQASTTSVQGVVDNKYVDLLESVIEQNNIPGQDYFEFKQATENMKAIVMDEKTKFQTVYQILSLQGCKKDVLISSIDTYIKVIQKEKANFDAEMKSAYDQKVQAKLAEAEKAKKELEAITKKVTELNNTIIALSQAAQQEEMQIRATESNFKASAELIVNEMVADKEKINLYIS